VLADNGSAILNLRDPTQIAAADVIFFDWSNTVGLAQSIYHYAVVGGAA
jgi:secreted protein with Ig-like and vWFA domain